MANPRLLRPFIPSFESLLLEPLLLLVELSEAGSFPVAAPPRYQLPISVRRPSWVNIAALGPTFETEERKEPKYE